MQIFLTVVQIIACIVLIASVLMQSGKSAGLSGSIGGGAEQIWGKQKGRGFDEMFDKMTKVAAVAFIICSMLFITIQ